MIQRVRVVLLPLSNHWRTTDNDDPVSRRVCSGYYIFDLAFPPELPKLGWRAGDGRK